MSNLVKQTQLKEVVVDLWNKVKGRTDVAFKEANYNETTQTITFTKIDDSTVDVALTDLVSKSNANVITGETLITDGYILGGIISKLDNQHTNMSSASLPHYFGLKSARVTTNQKLTHITIGIHDSVAVGTQITGIKVGAIKVSDNTISHYVVNDATATVQENKNSELTNCTRAVVVPLDTPFTPTEDSWFCVSCLNAAWGERSTALSSEDACTEGGNPNGIMPNIGSTVTVKRSGYLGKYLLHTDKISLNDLANVANGAVKTVNNQMPDGQGNVTVGIAHIDNLQTELDKIKENFVEHWGDLKYTTGYKYENLLDYDSRVQGKYFPTQDSGDVQDSPFWSIFHCPVRPNEEYTVLRKYEDSGRFVFYDARGTVVEVLELPYRNDINGWHRNFVRVPNNPDVAHMAFCFQTHSGLNVKGRIMLLKASNVTEELNFIPYSNSTMVVIDGDKVAIQFNRDSTSLQSNTVVEAIKELDGKIANAGTGTVRSVNNQNPDPQGNVTVGIDHIDGLRTELDGKVPLTKVGNSANQIPQIGADGKLDTSIIPELAISRVHTAANKQGAMDLIGAGTIQTGDVVVVTDAKNAIFMYNGTTGGTFETSFIELSIGDGTVKTVNGQSPDGTGAVTIKANQINLSTGEVLEDELKARVKTIGGQVARDGNIDLTLVLGTDKYELQANGTKITELPLMTAQEVQEIIALFV